VLNASLAESTDRWTRVAADPVEAARLARGDTARLRL